MSNKVAGALDTVAGGSNLGTSAGCMGHPIGLSGEEPMQVAGMQGPYAGSAMQFGPFIFVDASIWDLLVNILRGVGVLVLVLAIRTFISPRSARIGGIVVIVLSIVTFVIGGTDYALSIITGLAGGGLAIASGASRVAR